MLALIAALALAQSPDSAAIHRSALVVDTHADTTGRMLDEAFDLAEEAPLSEGHLDLAKVRAGNLGAQFFSIWVDPDEYRGRYAQRALAMIDAVHRAVEKHPGRLALCTTAAEVEAARAQDKLAALIGMEGGHAIENDLALLRAYHRLGVRYLTLTWNNTNEWADACCDAGKPKVKRHGGLTDRGREVVREMNRLGMIVDVSHVSDDTARAALAVSRAPVIASHSCARALMDNPRNMPDDVLRAVAAGGGVIHVTFVASFLSAETRKAYDGRRKRWNAEGIPAVKAKMGKADPVALEREMNRAWRASGQGVPRPPLSALIDHIDHVVKVAGIDHVGLGSDFDGTHLLPEGLDSVADLPKITAALVARGYSEKQIHQILGGNLMRVLRKVEEVARAPAP